MDENTEKPVFQTDKLAEGLRKARVFRGLTYKETCELLGIPTSKLQNYELGKYTPSLPEMEALAFIYGVPFEALMQPDDYPDLYRTPEKEPMQQLLEIRRKVNATRLQIAFEKAGTTFKDLETKTGVGSARIKRFLEGREDIPIDLLMTFKQTLDIPVEDLEDRESALGQWLAYKESAHQFTALSKESQEMLRKPEQGAIFEAAERITKTDADSLAALGDAFRQAAELARKNPNNAD